METSADGRGNNMTGSMIYDVTKTPILIHSSVYDPAVPFKMCWLDINRLASYNLAVLAFTIH